MSQLGDPWADEHPERVVMSQLRFTAELAGVDVSRAARWGYARAALSVSWLLDQQNGRAATAALREAMTWRTVSGA